MSLVSTASKYLRARSKEYSKHCQTSETEFFIDIFNALKQLTIFAESSILDI